MRNLTLSTPVLVAGAVVCLLVGGLVGSVAFPLSRDRTTAKVASFDSTTSRLCLTGPAARAQQGVDADGQLCGTWHTRAVRVPRVGEDFRFVSVFTSGESGGKKYQQVVIYGNVLG